MNTYIGLDCETGGVTMQESLLTAFYGIYDENFNLIDELYLQVKPDDGRYIVNGQALSVNKINLVEHDRIAISYKTARGILYDFLKRNYMGEKLIPIGHGVKFDVERTQAFLTSSWEDYCSYRNLCTSSVAQFLRATGKIPSSVSGSLGSLLEHFKIKPVGNLHHAKVDTLNTVLLLQALINLTNTK